MSLAKMFSLLLITILLWGCGGGGGSSTPPPLLTNSIPIADAGSDQTVDTGTTVTLDASASRDSDGDSLSYQWTIRSRPANSSADLSSATSSSPTFVADIEGNYVFELIVNDGQINSQSDSVTVNAISDNQPPIANAGNDQSVTTGSTVTLNGGESSDPDNDNLTYEWQVLTRPDGSLASLSDSTIEAPTFVADLNGTYIFELVVNDGQVNSPADSITVNASTPNQPPIADAGDDQSVTTGSIVSLNGGESSDPDNDNLTYDWQVLTRPDGSLAFLSDSAIEAPSFVPDLDGTYIFELVVNDGQVNSPADSITVNASTPNQPPIANAGDDQSVTTGSMVTLNGEGSSDPDGDNLTYQWQVLSSPNGSFINLSDSTIEAPTFVPDLDGTYIFELVVNDGQVNSPGDSITVNASTPNTPPIADAGDDQSVTTGSMVTLNGGGSSDPDGDNLTYQWQVLSSPEGSFASLSDSTIEAPTFVADLDGTYIFELVVNDGQVNSQADEVSIIASPDDGSLTATPVFDDQINLSWNDISDSEFGYEIEMSRDGVTGWRLFALEPANTTQRMATGLRKNTTHYFRIRTREPDGYSAYSNIASATSLDDLPVTAAYHVDPEGVSGETASDDNDGILISEGGTGPWLTVEHAWFNTPSGSTVYLRAGTHTISSQVTVNDSAQSGTFDAPTVMRNYPGELLPILDTTALNNGGDTGDGITWDGPDFWIHRGFRHEYGNQGFLVGWNRESTHNRWSRIVATDHGTSGGDNKGYISAWNGRAEGIIMEDLRVNGPGGSAHGNTGALYLSRMHQFTIKRVIAQNGRHTIHFKHAPSYNAEDGGKEFGALIQDAYFKNFTGSSFNGNYVVFDNIIYSDCGDLTFAVANGVSGGDYNSLRNITFHDTVLWLANDVQDGNGLEGAQFNEIKDIILSGSARLQVEEAQGFGVAQNNKTDYMIYPTGESIRYWFDSGALTNTDLDGWRSVNPLENQDQNSQTGDVRYSGGTDLRYAFHFRLADDSPVGLNSASHGGNNGADTAYIFTFKP